MADIDIKSDMLMGVANLIEAEHHARFSYLSTDNIKYMELLNELREIRANYMRIIEKEEESQLHCLNKHLLSSMFRLFEVGDKYLANANQNKAKSCYREADKLLSIFIELNWMDEKKSFIDKLKGK